MRDGGLVTHSPAWVTPTSVEWVAGGAFSGAMVIASCDAIEEGLCARMRALRKESVDSVNEASSSLSEEDRGWHEHQCAFDRVDLAEKGTGSHQEG
jgi:hypothetical protein